MAVSWSITDLAQAAEAVLPPDVWNYVAGGSGAERSLAANRAAWERLFVVPRVLRAIDKPTTGTELFGSAMALPVAVAPMAYQRAIHPDGELATAAAARRAGVPFVISTFSSTTMEAIAGTGAAMWFQLYWLRDGDVVDRLVARAEECGCHAIMVTVDVPRMGRRLRDLRAGFALPATVTPANLPSALGDVRASPGSAIADHTREIVRSDLGWDDIERLRRRTSLPVIVKGLLDPADASRAAALGVDGVVVSNHGGRQLDGAVPATAVLPAVRAAVGEEVKVLLDGGIQDGLDVLKAIGLGADAVLLGRSVLYGLAVAGEAGVAKVLELVGTELEDAMLFAGCGGLSDARAVSLRSADVWPLEAER